MKKHADEQYERAARAGCHQNDDLDAEEAERLFGDADE